MFPEDAARFICGHDRFLILCHISPDGDTIGCGLALHAGLLSMGKSSSVVCQDPVPGRYSFLPYAGAVIEPEKAEQAEAVICVDVASADRTGTARVFLDGAKYTLNIDHHGTNTRYAQVNCVQARGAAAELVHELLRALEIPLNADIATCLYTAIVTDTGNFAYSSTTPETLRIAADILAAGIPFPDLQQILFHKVPFRKILLKQKAYGNLRLIESGRGVVSVLTLEDIASSNALASDTEGIVEDLRDIDTVEIAALLREEEDCVRLSLRGKSSSDVSVIAVRLGGGGHRLAAGATLRMPVGEAADLISRLIVEALLQCRTDS